MVGVLKLKDNKRFAEHLTRMKHRWHGLDEGEPVSRPGTRTALLLELLFGQEFGVGVADLGAEGGADAVGGFVDELELAGEVAGGVRDRHNADGGSIPDRAFIQLGDRGVEGVAEFFLERTRDLATILERLRVGDVEFEGQTSDGHSFGTSCGIGLGVVLPLAGG